MNIKLRLEKLEKKLEVSGIPNEVFQKVGSVPFCQVDNNMPEEEKTALISKTKAEYFEKIANELHTTQNTQRSFIKKKV